jgi:two-component system CheB/CheR fusion protein
VKRGATTRFFRDAEACEHVRRSLLPAILASRRDDLRVWTVGSGAGEETYSMAILLHEAVDEVTVRPSVRVFGTDADAGDVARARLGRYPAALVEREVPATRLRRFFERQCDVYKVDAAVRRTCMFAQHLLVRDAPFRGCDLSSAATSSRSSVRSSCPR